MAELFGTNYEYWYRTWLDRKPPTSLKPRVPRRTLGKYVLLTSNENHEIATLAAEGKPRPPPLNRKAKNMKSEYEIKVTGTLEYPQFLTPESSQRPDFIGWYAFSEVK